MRKASNFSKPVSTARQMVRSEVSMITRICCTSFSKSPRLRTPSSFRVFHLWRGPARDFDAKPRLFEWASYSCNVTPLPAIPRTVLMHPRNSFSVPSIVLLCHHRFLGNTCLHVPQHRRRNGEREQPFSLSASCHLALTNAIAPISVTQFHATSSGHSIG